MPSETKHRQHMASAANPPHLCPPVARCRSRRFFPARRQAYNLCDVRPVARSEAFIIRSAAWSIRHQRPLSAPAPARFCRAARCCRLSPLLLGPLNTIRCQLEGKENPRAAVDARKAPSSPNGHGLRPPFGRSSAGEPSLFAAEREKVFLSSFPSSPPDARRKPGASGTCPEWRPSCRLRTH